MNLAEGIFLRACFEQEQQLTRLAIEAAKTSMLVFAQAHRRKDLQPAQRRWCAEMRGRMNALAKTLLKSGSGSRATGSSSGCSSVLQRCTARRC
mgnify:CR=1 FL=1